MTHGLDPRRIYAWIGSDLSDEMEDENIGRYLARYRFKYIDDQPRLIEPLGNRGHQLKVAVVLGVVATGITFGLTALIRFLGGPI